MQLRPVSLADRYEKTEGEVLLTGIQALTRLPLDQRRRDAAQGQDTAGFISGYRGSPLGGYDQELVRAAKYLAPQNVVFTPGVNEELGATAVWGSQQTNLFPGAKFAGTFGIWYGKAPGVDRSIDALRHANFAGTSPLGGVLALCGDDHDCKSSTLPSQSEYALMHAEIPVLNPASVQEVLDYGLLGIALSRATGLWAGLIALADTMDSGAVVNVSPDRLRLVMPDIARPPEGLHIRLGDTPLLQEERMRRFKLPAALEFARANHLNRIIADSPAPRLGLIAAGRAFEDLMQALEILGITPDDCARLGLRILKLGMTWPLDAQQLRPFARGLEAVLVIESKRPLIEDQLRQMLYDLPAGERPHIMGKQDMAGKPLLSDTRALTAASIARVLLTLLPHAPPARGAEYLAAVEAQEQRIRDLPAQAARTPFYCSGCPHNTSTKLPEGSRGMAGIGCHYMVTWMDRDTHLFSQMGGEGVHWVGQQPFTTEPHVFVNLGDGTYFHSGILAIRQAVGAKLNITYKILYNDAVAMTGGQSVDGPLTPQMIAQQVLAEGVGRVVVVADDVARYAGAPPLPPGVALHPRAELDSIQKDLRQQPGVTVIIYDQVCAAEKRRRRKRKLMPDPAKRLFINPAVCEGCGDCSVQSNCISVEPLETPLGRKRRINQSSCNKDYSCAKGFCPSFVEVEGGALRKASTTAAPGGALPEPALPAHTAPFNIFLTGIGGTGITTVAALLSHAAHLQGLRATELNMTGLAQKGGAVTSHVRLAPAGEELNSPRIAYATTDLLLACDLLVSVTPDALRLLRPARTRAVVNTDIAPTAAFVRARDTHYDAHAPLAALHSSVQHMQALDATRIAEAVIGDSIAANVLQLGYAYQQGWLPLTRTALEGAIRLNGTAIEQNLAAFSLGRRLAHQPALAQSLLAAEAPPEPPQTLDAIIAHRVQLLTDYQSPAYAERYRALVEKMRAAETALDGGCELTEAVARNFAKLMAYKDEYEVGRLYSAPAFRAALAQQFTGELQLSVLLAPPLLSRKDPATGHAQKMRFGAWVFPLFRLLAALKGLRGTPLDIFGLTAERRSERALRDEYERDMLAALPGLARAHKPLLLALARLPEDIRGFGHVKEASMKTAQTRRAALKNALMHPQPQAPERLAAE